MKKFAIFVEGLTEQEFEINLLKKLAAKRTLSIELHSQRHGSLQLVANQIGKNIAPEWYVLVANCNNDEQVKTQIIDNYQSLLNSGYQYIIGLKDVYPFKSLDLPRLKAGLPKGLPVGQVPIDMHLAVMEIETWFLEEHTHFQRIHPEIDEQAIRNLGYDRSLMKAEDIYHPAELLHLIYKTVGLAYKKSRRHVDRTVNSLDFDEIFNLSRTRSPSLEGFLTSIEQATI